jgi:dimethylargininase
MRSANLHSGPGTAVVRSPGPQLADGLVTHLERTAVDLALARRQWRAYVDVLIDAGWKVQEAPAADHCPDAVFIEDPVVVFDRLAVITRPGAPERRAETDELASLFAGLGLDVTTLSGPGSLDGGDVLKVGRTVYVGRSARTDTAGIASLAVTLGSAWHVVEVPTTKALHLKSAVTALPDGTVIGWDPVVDDPSLFGEFRAMPEEHGAHGVELGPQHLLMSAAAPESARLLETEGYRVSRVDISEFEKLEGCVTCLSVRVR